jgi:hypothetical protein
MVVQNENRKQAFDLRDSDCTKEFDAIRLDCGVTYTKGGKGSTVISVV